MNKDVARILISEEEIKNKSKELGMLINEEYKDKKAPILVALLKGSVPFLAELIKHIDLDIEARIFWDKSDADRQERREG